MPASPRPQADRRPAPAGGRLRLWAPASDGKEPGKRVNGGGKEEFKSAADARGRVLCVCVTGLELRPGAGALRPVAGRPGERPPRGPRPDASGPEYAGGGRLKY